MYAKILNSEWVGMDFNQKVLVQVCLNICHWSWSSSRSSSTRNISQSDQSKGHGSLHVCALGNVISSISKLLSMMHSTLKLKYANHDNIVLKFFFVSHLGY